MKEIPSIDLNFGFGPSVEKSEAVKGIRAACSETGFFSIVNHGLSEEVLKSCWQDAQDFFNLPEGEKLKTAVSYAGYPVSYTHLTLPTTVIV